MIGLALGFQFDRNSRHSSALSHSSCKWVH